MTSKDERPLVEKATSVVQKLRRAGFEACFAGGSVRDLLRGVEPKDYDIATSATPDEVIATFRHTIPLGKQFGVVQVRYGGEGFEVATFRTDVSYSDGRRPDGVTFATAEEDVLRRDFTINGLLYDPVEKQVFDHVGGQVDLEKGCIRAIGDATDRFAEDKLRMLRAIRFASTLNFEIEAETWAAICAHASQIIAVSAERIRTELIRTLTEGGAARGIQLLADSGLTRAIFGQFSEALQPSPPMPELLQSAAKGEPLIAWALWWHRLDAAAAEELGGRLRLANAERAFVAGHLRAWRAWPDIDASDRARWIRFLRDEDTQRFLVVGRHLAEHGVVDPDDFGRLARDGRELEPEFFPERLINGRDLGELGCPRGPAFKTILTAVEDAQLRGEVSTREEAVEAAKSAIAAL